MTVTGLGFPPAGLFKLAIKLLVMTEHERSLDSHLSIGVVQRQTMLVYCPSAGNPCTSVDLSPYSKAQEQHLSTFNMHAECTAACRFALVHLENGRAGLGNKNFNIFTLLTEK